MVTFGVRLQTRGRSSAGPRWECWGKHSRSVIIVLFFKVTHSEKPFLVSQIRSSFIFASTDCNDHSHASSIDESLFIYVRSFVTLPRQFHLTRLLLTRSLTSEKPVAGYRNEGDEEEKKEKKRTPIFSGLDRPVWISINSHLRQTALTVSSHLISYTLLSIFVNRLWFFLPPKEFDSSIWWTRLIV